MCSFHTIHCEANTRVPLLSSHVWHQLVHITVICKINKLTQLSQCVHLPISVISLLSLNLDKAPKMNAANLSCQT